MRRLMGKSGLLFGRKGYYAVNFVLATINVFLVGFNYFAFGNVLYVGIASAIVLYSLAAIFGEPPDFIKKLLGVPNEDS